MEIRFYKLNDFWRNAHFYQNKLKLSIVKDDTNRKETEQNLREKKKNKKRIENRNERLCFSSASGNCLIKKRGRKRKEREKWKSAETLKLY